MPRRSESDDTLHDDALHDDAGYHDDLLDGGHPSARRRVLATAAAFAVLCALVVVGARATRDGGGSSAAVADTTVADTVPPTVATTTTVPGPLPCPPATGATERVASFELAPPQCLVAGATYRAVVTTSEGSFTITLDPAGAPRNVNSFVYLARYRFYDGLAFNRVVPGFIVQGGDPTGDGTGGPGYTVPDELPTGAYAVGTVAMANSGPDTNGSQFFVVSGALGKELPRSYPVLGTVTSGLDVVRRIDALGVAPGDDGSEKPPVRRITIESVRIEQEGGEPAGETTTAAPTSTAAAGSTATTTSAPPTNRPASA